MSLRARLVAGLLLLAAAGLLIVGGVTYVEQRSFLQDRVDAAGPQRRPGGRAGVAGRGLRHHDAG